MLPITNRKLTVGKTLVDTIPKGLKHDRKAIKRTFLDARQVTNAINHLGRLPTIGESFHFIVDGDFEPCALIPATRMMSDPAIIKHLTITTLGLNDNNVHTIAAGIDQGKVLSCSILVSEYFAKVDKDDFQFLKQEIESRKGLVHSMRTHCKLILMEMTDGNHYTIEGSGNLRACRSVEQFAMTNDAELLKFHRTWIDQYIQSRGDGRETLRRRKKQNNKK